MTGPRRDADPYGGRMRFRVLLCSVLVAGATFLAGVSTASAAAGEKLPSGRTTYRTLADYTRDMDHLEARYPDLVRRTTLREPTVEGRVVEGVELAASVNATDDGRPTFLLTALTHAREWSSGEIAMEWAMDIARSYGREARMTRLLHSIRLVIIPVVNPDGFVTSRAAAPGTAARMHRTNCEPGTPAEQLLPCAQRSGVDLNRNHGFAWGGVGSSPTPGSEQYRGPGPWSEPEASGLHELAAARQVTGAVSLHNFGGSVLRQPGFRAFGQLPDERRQAALGRRMADAAGYASAPADQLYDSTGAQEDWSYANQDALAYTIEVGGSSFQGPYRTDVIEQYRGRPNTPSAGRGLRESLLIAAQGAAKSSGHAILTGAAPGVRLLTLSRTFTTNTSPVCAESLAANACPSALTPIAIADGIETHLLVPASGTFRWGVAPSTGPQDERAGRTTAWTLRCEAPEGFPLGTPQQLTVKRGQVRTVKAACG